MPAAVVVIDVQHALCTGRWAASDIDAFIARTNHLTGRADAHSTTDKELLSAAQISRHHTLTLSRLGSFEVAMKVAMASEMEFAVP